MECQNITLSVPKEILRRVKHIAVERNTSVSGLMVEMLEELVHRDDAYEQARERHMALLKKGFNLGTNGKITWTRDELHERR
ncbi:MAG: CopG family transcriptional regulator [Bacteroidota bacterium]